MALVIVIILFIWALQYYSQPALPPSAITSANVLEQNYYPVKRIVDGDTFIYLIGDEERTVRILGADTPETKDPRKPVQCFGEEANNAANKILAGQSVRLERDLTALNVDMYGRELRYVYLPDGTMVNRYLIENGFAHVTRQSPFRLQQEFVNLENEARIAGRGLWSPQACN